MSSQAIDLQSTTTEGLANALYDHSGELMANPELVLFVLNHSSRDLSQASGPIDELAGVLTNMYKDLKWGKLEFVTAVLTALASAVNDVEFAGYEYSDDDFASVGYTQEVHLHNLVKPLTDRYPGEQRLPEDSPRGYRMVRIMYDLLQHNGFSVEQLVGAIVVAEAEAGVDNSAETYSQILTAVGKGVVEYVEEQRG